MSRFHAIARALAHGVVHTVGVAGLLGAALLGAGLLGAGGCSFQVPGIPLGGESDLAISSAPPDLGADLARQTFTPAHVAPSHVQEGAASLVGVKDIDTDGLLLDGKMPPPGVIFIPEATHDEWAVLSVRDFDVTAELKIHGRRAFILVATGAVHVSAIVHAEALQRLPGPGGQFTGLGRGGDGKSSINNDSGGGGAGHRVVGAAGGDSNAITNAMGGAGGVIYATELTGGSGGGDGAGVTTAVPGPCPTGEGWSLGGAGGGVVQLSAKLSLDVNEQGGISAGGGGGRGGCKASASSGGGGGSGGTIWLEAPTMRIVGKLAANGGGGGSGGLNVVVTLTDGVDGQDGRLDRMGAQGGASPGAGGGTGGNGGSLMTDATPGKKDTNAGGGGGAVGHIRLRTRSVSPVTSVDTLISPAAEKSVDF